MTIRTLIVDDESLARKRVKRFLAGEPDVTVIGECGSGREAIKAIQEAAPDLVFLDIQMPEISGFEVLRSIPREQMPIIIFTTAYDQHALKAFEVHALDYLLKPFKQERFQTALEHVRAQITKNGSHETNPGLTALIEKVRVEQNYVDRFMIKTSNRIVFVKAGDVDWIESAANYVLLHVGDKTHIVRETMRSLEARLCPKTFQRISRSAIVNVERIQELQPMGKGEYVVFLTTGKQLSMSRGIRELNQALGSS